MPGQVILRRRRSGTGHLSLVTTARTADKEKKLHATRSAARQTCGPPLASRLRSEALCLQKHLVHIAPRPVIPRLDRPHDRVLAPVEMLGRVLVLRRVAAADVAAGEAEPEMDP